MIAQLLSGTAAQVAQWRNVLQAALGQNGRLITDLFPQLALIVGPQPPVAELPPLEAQNRFHLVFAEFIGVFSQKDHPLVLFLDDLQWADPASLRLLKELLTPTGARFLLVVGAYRPNEVDPRHPLQLTLEEMRQGGVSSCSMALEAFSFEALVALLGDTLHAPGEAIEPLAELVWEKTAGNPFFTLQFLLTLYEERLLQFDAQRGIWRWEGAQIRAQRVSDNVVDLLVEKMQRLPKATLGALKLAACLGHRAELAILARVRGRSEAELDAELLAAIRGGLLLRLEGGYQFPHDRVQEAAYSLALEESCAEAHLKIGRSLAAEFSKEARGEQVFEVANHLNQALELITEPAERALLRRFNFLAGAKAKASIAYAAAARYLAQASELLPTDAWQSHYEETLSLSLERSECEYLVGHFQLADELFGQLLENVRSPVEGAQVYRLRIRLHQLSGRYEVALETLWDALRLLGMSLPAEEKQLQRATELKVEEVCQALSRGRIADLLEAPRVRDPQIGALIGLLGESLSLVFVTRPGFHALLTATTVGLSLQHGHLAESAFAYSSFAILLASRPAQVEAAFELSEMALRLLDKLQEPRLKGRLLLVHGVQISHWVRPLANSVALLEASFGACREVGDLAFAGWSAASIVWARFENGEPLDEVLQAARRYDRFLQESHNEVLSQVVWLQEQFIERLRGGAGLGDGAEEQARVAALSQANFGSGIALYHVSKMLLCFLFGEYAEAHRAAQQAADCLPPAKVTVLEVTHDFYFALTLTALYPQASLAEQEKFLPTLRAALQKLQLWAARCPENYQTRCALLQAELARIEGRDLEAMRAYEEAIRAARENGFVQNEALGAELAAKFYRARGLELSADAYLRAARSAYARWGADAKVQQLDAFLPPILERKPGAFPTIAAYPEQVDLLTVLKVSRAVSGEIALDRLVATLLRGAMENAGAQKGALILAHGEELRLEARAEGAEVTLLAGSPVADAPELPHSILDFVRRSQTKVVLDDAARDPIYAADAYLAQAKPKSVLGLPILKQASLIGVLYLENHLASGVFTPQRLALLELLAAQAAISLQNALLYAALQQENEVRKQAEAEVRKLNTELEGRVLKRTVELRRVNEALRAESRRRARVAEAARRNQTRFAAFMENLPGLAFMKDREGKYVYLNEQCAAPFGRKTSAVLGLTDEALWPPEVAARIAASDQRILQTGQPLRFEEPVSQTDGGRLWLVHKFPIFDSVGRAELVGVLAVDITERKRAEEQVQSALKKEALLRREIHHRVKNNLQVISSLLFLQSTHVSDPKTLEILRESQARARSIALVHEKLYQSDNLGQVEVAGYLQQLAADLFNFYRVSPQEVRLAVQAEDLLLGLDAAIPCGLIITELVSNALKHAFPAGRGGELTIGFRPVGRGLLQLLVRDDGVGLPADFDLAKAKTLGLRLIYDLTRQLGGTIHIKSDCGAAVQITFPEEHSAK